MKLAQGDVYLECGLFSGRYNKDFAGPYSCAGRQLACWVSEFKLVVKLLLVLTDEKR